MNNETKQAMRKVMKGQDSKLTDNEEELVKKELEKMSKMINDTDSFINELKKEING